MLIVPMTNKINLKNPPLVTIGLIAVTILIYFVFQLDDTEHYITSQRYYYDSGLAETELTCYLAYLGDSLKMKQIPQLKELDAQKIHALHHRMESDVLFLAKLKSEKIITTTDPGYARWKASREKYEGLKAQVVSYTYGFKPACFSVLTLFTYMFLHGSIWHLTGNVIFLWLAGSILEAGCGRVRYLFVYLFTGVCAALLFKLAYFHSTVPLVGASGAISGLMGAFTVLFGRKKLKVFLTLGFFFNYMKIKGVYLFVLWVGNEVVQLVWGGVSNTAYVAHIGGLLAGGAVALVLARIPGAVDKDLFQDEDPLDHSAAMIDQALEKIARLHLEEGKQILLKVLEKDPANSQALEQLFKIYKQSPKSPRFHTICEKLMDHLIRDKAHTKAHNLFFEYHGAAKNIKLSPGLLVRFCFSLCEAGHPEIAGKLVISLINKDKTIPGLSAAMFRIAAAFKQKQDVKRCQQFYSYICKLFPNSNEASLVQEQTKKETG